MLIKSGYDDYVLEFIVRTESIQYNIWQSITLIQLQAFCLQTFCLQDLPRDSSRLARAARAIQIAWYVISEAIPHEKLEDFVFLEITFGHVQHDLISRKNSECPNFKHLLGWVRTRGAHTF